MGSSSRYSGIPGNQRLVKPGTQRRCRSIGLQHDFGTWSMSGRLPQPQRAHRIRLPPRQSPQRSTKTPSSSSSRRESPDENTDRNNGAPTSTGRMRQSIVRSPASTCRPADVESLMQAPVMAWRQTVPMAVVDRFYMALETPALFGGETFPKVTRTEAKSVHDALPAGTFQFRRVCGLAQEAESAPKRARQRLIRRHRSDGRPGMRLRQEPRGGNQRDKASVEARSCSARSTA